MVFQRGDTWSFWLGIVFGILVFAHVGVLCINPSWFQTWSFYFWPVLSLWCCLLSLFAFMIEDTFGGFLFAVYAAGAAWFWWQNYRHRRKKLIEKVLGRVVVRDAGLKVVPE